MRNIKAATKPSKATVENRGKSKRLPGTAKGQILAVSPDFDDELVDFEANAPGKIISVSTKT